MGFWRSFGSYLNRKLDESNERAAAERAERNRRQAIQQEGHDYGYGYQKGMDDAKTERPKPWETNRPSRPQPDPWRVHVPTERETGDIWFGSDNPRKKKKQSNNFW